MSQTTFVSRVLSGSLAMAMTAYAGAASAIEFTIFDSPLKIDNLVTIGASFRTQDRDPTNVGKTNYDPGLCFIRDERNGAPDTTPDAGPSPYPEAAQGEAGGAVNHYNIGTIREACTTTDPVRLADYLSRPGANAPNADEGNLNFDRGDIVHAVAKITADISYSLFDYNIFIRPIYFFDARYTDYTITHSTTELQSRTAELGSAAEQQIGTDLQFLDYNISHLFTVFDHDINVKVGDQVLNWGESSLLVFNSLNSINVVDEPKVRFPGSDLKEFFQPQGMAVVGTDLFETVSLEGWYQYEWKPLIVSPVGTFFSQSDTLGVGGRYGMLSQGRVPDDPGFSTTDPRYVTGQRGFYRAIDTCGNPPDADHPTGCIDPIGALGSTSSRTIFRDYAEEHRRRPSDGGQYGLKVGLFLEDFNNGTELAFYHANYHSRFPIASFMAADATCLVGGNAAASAASCGLGAPGTNADNVSTANIDEEPVPVDTVRIVVEYPEDIRLYGMSFNTTLGDYALSGEYAFRDNMPMQIHTTDVTFAALSPAFPSSDVPVAPGVTVPGRASAVPDFISKYRKPGCSRTSDGADRCVSPGEYIPGYERMKFGQLNLTVLRLIGGDNPIGASQMTLLLEMGMAQVFDMPSLAEIQFNGGGTDTAISSGADGSWGINPKDLQCTPGAAGCNQGMTTPTNLRQNVTAQYERRGFGTSESYGYRFLNLNRWDSALFGANLETLTIVQHDVKGTTPGIATNFTDGRKQIAFGLRFDYLSTYIGEVRYSWNTGGGNRDVLRDRDNIFVTLGYQF